MTKKIAILQSNYIPWKGYFDIINSVDVFVIYDCVQYTKNDWRNRNQILTQDGLKWLTIPVQQKHLNQKIEDTYVANGSWRKKHWHTLSQAYSKAPYFKKYSDIVEKLYLDSQETNLSEINKNFIFKINEILNIKTPIVNASDMSLVEGQSERLIDICQQHDATHYLSGPAAKNYLDENKFINHNISVEWVDYSGYPPYQQIHTDEFINALSIFDLIFNTGENAMSYLKGA